jgi:hypothetical protein
LRCYIERSRGQQVRNFSSMSTPISRLKYEFLKQFAGENMTYLCQTHSIQKNSSLITSGYLSLIIVMVESDSLLDILELVAIINKNEYQDIND